MTSVTCIETRCNDEVIRLHVFFVEWFTASILNTKENFDVFNMTMAVKFHIISPRGVVDTKVELTSNLRCAYGIHKDSIFTIKSKNYRLLFVDGKESCLMRYNESQNMARSNGDVVKTGQILIVLFREQSNCFIL